MEPTIKDNTLTIATKVETPNPKIGSIVIVQKDGKNLIKRVIAQAGDIVEIKGKDLYINGKKQKEKYIKEPMGYVPNAFDDTYVNTGYDLEHFDYKYVVPANSIYVMGDNRNDSWDSRHYGAFKKDEIFANVLVVTPIPYTVFKYSKRVILVAIIIMLIYNIVSVVIENKNSKKKIFTHSVKKPIMAGVPPVQPTANYPQGKNKPVIVPPHLNRQQGKPNQTSPKGYIIPTNNKER